MTDGAGKRVLSWLTRPAVMRPAFVAWVALVLVLTLNPGTDVGAPGLRIDLLAHFVAMGGVAFLLAATRWCGPLGSARSVLLTGVLASVFAVADEAAQSMPWVNRVSDPSDLAANLLGVGCALVASVFVGAWLGTRGGVNGAAAREHDGFLGHARSFALVTLASRVFGLVRDVLLAAVLGRTELSSAFFAAFLVPNIFRRLFGEGALTAAFIPEYAKLAEQDAGGAERFASATVLLVAGLLSIVTVVGELGLLVVFWWLGGFEGPLEATGDAKGIVLMTMVMLPFMPVVCVTAALGGMLQSHGRFVPVAAAPIVLNLCMGAAVAAATWIYKAEPSRAALALAVSVPVAGVLQLAWCVLELRGIVRWTRVLAGAGARVRLMVRRMLPVLVGSGTAQLGLLIDSLLAAWPVLVAGTVAAAWAYPLDEASNATMYYAQRLEQLPIGVFAVAVATAVFPALARQAHDEGRFARTLARGMRVSAFLGIPAALGLAAAVEPIVAAVYQGGAFDAQDTRRVAPVLMLYAPAIAAAGLIQILVRGFYARDLPGVPMRIGIAAVALNTGLNAVLMWPMREAGLALATSIAMTLQLAALWWAARRWYGDGRARPVLDAQAWRSVVVSLVCAVAMAAAVRGVVLAWGPTVYGSRGEAAVVAGLAVAVGAAVYLGSAVVLRRVELRWLLSRRADADIA